MPPSNKPTPSPEAADPRFIQEAATAAWNDDTHVEERNRVFAEKRALFLTFFERAGFRWTPTNASLYLWVEVPEEYGGDDELYALRLLEEGIIVAPGSSFGPGGEGYFRVALVPGLEECEEAIARWEGLVP